jgi:predicted transporter
MTGGREPVTGRERGARSAGLAVRALLIATLGLALGELETGLAIILTYYGVLFLLGLPFVGLRARSLFVLAAVWVVLGPVISQLTRPELPDRQFASPAFDQLADPGQLIGELLFTGYYPCVPWLAYLLVGMAVGRLDLRRGTVHAWLAGAGLALVLAATWISRWLTAQDAVMDRLLADSPGRTGSQLLDSISGGMFGQTPVGGSWAWLLVVAPHSSTPFDLAQTIGSAILVIGLCLGLVGMYGEQTQRVVAIVFGAGTMTLTLYSLHVVMRTQGVWPPEVPGSFGWHLVVLMSIGAVFVALRRRGPLEQLVSSWSNAAAALVRGDSVRARN